MILADGYNTSYGQNTNRHKLEQSIAKALDLDYISHQTLGMQETGGYRPIFILGQGDSEMAIGLFAHPINVFHKGKHYIVSDLRLNLTEATDADLRDNKRLAGGRRIRDMNEHGFSMVRAAMQTHWMANPKSSFLSSTRFASVVYAKVITQAIARFASLDIAEQYRLEVVWHYFYQLLHLEKDPDAEQLEAMMIHTIKAVGIPSAEVENVYMAIGAAGGFNDIIDVCDKLEEIVGTVRLKGFTLGVLLQLVNTIWYGLHAKEIVAVSLEHPPTWVTIVRAAAANNTYKSTAVYRSVERMARKANLQEFVRNVEGLARELSDEI